MPLDPAPLSRLYKAHAADLLSFFARRTLQAEVAIDLVAETFSQAFAHREQFRGASDGEALAWIFGIARHELSAYFRRGAVDRRAMAELGLAVPTLTNADYERVEELAVPFQCVAASIERAAEHWFADGLLTDVVLASCAVPGILPPVAIGDEHFIDGGIVNSIPVARAVALGAKTIYVLQVGRLERPLQPPRWPWEVGLVAFEVARRHRFASDLLSLPDGVRLHVLPTGGSAAPAYNDLSGQLRVRRMVRGVQQQIDSSYEASLRYLQGL